MDHMQQIINLCATKDDGHDLVTDEQAANYGAGKPWGVFNAAAATGMLDAAFDANDDKVEIRALRTEFYGNAGFRAEAIAYLQRFFDEEVKRRA